MLPRLDRVRAAIRPSLACLGIVLIVPVCATLWLGGADWAVSDSLRLSWYGEVIAWPLLVALIGWILVACSTAPAGIPPAEFPAAPTFRRAHAFASLGLGLTALAVGILWSGGVRLSFLSLGSPVLSAWGAIGFFCVSAFLLLRSRRAADVVQTAQARAEPADVRPSPSSCRPSWIAIAAVLVSLGLGLLLQISLASLDLRSMTRAIEAAPAFDESAQGAAGKPDVLWVVVDTLRADALGVYGRGGARTGGAKASVSPTPFLDALADRGVLFERALAPAPWTVPSMFSAFTALWPSSLDPEGRGRSRSAEERIGLDQGVPTWIDVMRENGYHAAAFQKNPFLGEGTGLETRFDLYRMVGGDRAEGESAGQLVNAALRWGDAMRTHRDRCLNSGEAPYLLYLHFMDPHIDYAPPAGWLPEETKRAPGSIDGRARTLHQRLAEGPAITAAERARLASLYSAEVAYLDAELARLWAGLEERMLVDLNTLVVVTGDHGEQFGEHGGWEHGDLFSENLHVPFMIAGAGVMPRRVSEPVSLLDLGPTLLERLALPAIAEAEGQSLLSNRGVSDPVSARPILSEYGARARVELGRWVWVEGRVRGAAQSAALYDRVEDPGEKKDQAMLRPEIAERLRKQLAAHRARGRAAGEHVRPLSDDRRLERELKALGYDGSSE